MNGAKSTLSSSSVSVGDGIAGWPLHNRIPGPHSRKPRRAAGLSSAIVSHHIAAPAAGPLWVQGGGGGQHRLAYPLVQVGAKGCMP